MNRYYITDMDSGSGIGKYSRDFFNLVLKDAGYKYIRSSMPLNEILSLISSRDRIHIELGIFQSKEINILLAMTRANYPHLTVTLHDAPLLKYPYYSYSQPWLNVGSKLVDRLGFTTRAVKKILEKVETIYVLTQNGAGALTQKYYLGNIRPLPHIIDPKDMVTERPANNSLLFFGFVGKNKGTEYALNIHRNILNSKEDTDFFVVGKAIGKQSKYYQHLRKTFTRRVQFTGYMPDDKASAIFSQTRFAVLPFKDYRFFHPVSGSTLYCLKKGLIVFASPTNAIPELISDGVNGFYLTGDLDNDVHNILKVMDDEPLQETILYNSRRLLLERHGPQKVKAAFKSTYHDVLRPHSQL